MAVCVCLIHLCIYPMDIDIENEGEKNESVPSQCEDGNSAASSSGDEDRFDDTEQEQATEGDIVTPEQESVSEPDHQISQGKVL